MKRIDEWSSGARGQAFEQAVSPHVEAMRRAALRLLQSEDLAWDAVQETLLRAWRYPSLPAEPRSVLLSLVRRSCLHILRCARRRADHEHLASEEHHARCCPMDPAGDPAATAAERDELNGAAAAAARLTREHREVLELVAWRGLSYGEAARELQVPIGTIRSRTSRARAALERLLDSNAPENGPC